MTSLFCVFFILRDNMYNVSEPINIIHLCRLSPHKIWVTKTCYRPTRGRHVFMLRMASTKLYSIPTFGAYVSKNVNYVICKRISPLQKNSTFYYRKRLNQGLCYICQATVGILLTDMVSQIA